MQELIGRIFIILILLTFIEGCNKDKVLGEKLLSPEIKNTSPFKGSETLVFIKGDDTLRLKCQFRKDEIIKGYPSVNSSDYFILERSYILFRGDQSFLNLEIKTEISWDTPRLIINFVDTTDMVSECAESWHLPLDTSYVSDNYWFVNMMDVQGQSYSNVYCAKSECYGNPPQYPDVIYYYTKENGLIKYEYEDGSSWELLNIEW